MPRPDSVAFLLGNPPAVSETFIWNQITALTSIGIHVDIYAFPAENSYILEQRYGIRYIDLPELPSAPRERLRASSGLVFDTLKRPDLWPSLRCLNPAKYGLAGLSMAALHFVRPFFQNAPPDVVHCQFGMQGRFGAILADLGYPSRLVTTFHGLDLNVVPHQKGIDYYDLLFETGDAFTVNSDFSRRRLLSLGCPAERIHVMPMGIPISKFRLAERQRESDRPIRLLSVARLVPVKGLRYAIRAVAKVRAMRADVDLSYHIVGAGELRGALEELIEELGAGDFIHLRGALPHDDVLDEYAEADIFILPSIKAVRGDEETQGVVVQEAQASGLPVIVTDTGGVPEGMEHGHSGLVCDPESVSSLADALQWMLDHASQWREMGRAGRKLVEENYSLEAMQETLLGIYDTVLRDEFSGREPRVGS